MNDDEFNNKILEKVKLNIAISNFEKEEKPMNFTKILKMAAMFVVVIGLVAGVAYAGSIVYEKVFSKPEKIENYIDELKVNEEDLSEIISEDEAVSKAIEQLKRYKINLDKTNIENIELQKSPNYDSITYVIATKNNDNFFIDANTGDLRSFDLDDGLSLEEIEKCTSTRDEIIKQAQEKMKEYGYSDEYKISYVNCNNGDDEENAYMWYIWFSKEYDGIFNEYQSINMTIIPKINMVTHLSIEDEPFENNPIEISEEQAIEIAKEKDKVINSENYIQSGVESNLAIARVNPQVYLKENNLENGNQTIMLEDGTTYSYNTYKMNGRVRKVYAISISYENRPFDIPRTYYVDCTTGEVIGGEDIFDSNIDEDFMHNH